MNYKLKVRFFKMLLGTGLVAVLLSSCGEPTATPVVVANETATAIPTFTEVRVTPATATPTLIVVPPTDTPTPVVAPTPTITARPTPTATPSPTPTPRPTPTPPPTLSPDEIRQRYKIPLPTYLPADFQLERLTVQEVANTRVVSLLAEYFNPKPPGARFFYSVQLVILPTPTPTLPATATPTLAPGLTAAPVLTATSTPPPTPRPTLPLTVPIAGTSGELKVEEVTVRNVKALVSYRTDFPQSTLAWAEPDKTFSLNGALSKEEILKVAAGLQ